jgi:hypothetical protein
MREMKLKNIINDEEKDENELLYKEENNLGNVLIEGKINEFKVKIIKQFNYFEEHYIINALLKLLFGLVILALPFICIIIFISINFSEKNNYFFLPYFISVCLIIGTLMILLVIKLGEGCQMYGIIIYSWERKNLFKIFNSIIIGFHLLWFFFLCEKYAKSFNLLKEKVAQISMKESTTKLFNKGSYTLRILFILFFWDSEKNKEGFYIHQNLDYFDYEEYVFSEFHSYIQFLLIPIIFLSFYHLFKIIFFKESKQILFLILNILIAFQSFYIIFYPMEIKEDDFNENYFSNTNCKYFELIVYISIIILLIIQSFYLHIIKLIRKKYFPRKIIKEKEKEKRYIIIIIISILSFLINLVGYIIIIILIFSFSFDEINERLKIDEYHHYWLLIYISLTLIFFGYSFVFGHYSYNLIYYPISYETTPHDLKNEFYAKCSGKLIENDENSKIRLSKKSFDKLNSLNI